MMQRALNKLLNRSNYQQLNTIYISKHNLLQNYNYLASIHSEIAVAPVLKSNAYGHGLVHVAKIVDTINAPFLCVDSLYEGYELLKAGIKTQILIMGYTNPQNFKVKKLPFAYAVYDLEFLQLIKKYQPQAQIHLFVDTGMHREGIRIEELSQFLEQLNNFPKSQITGLMSHFACGDDPYHPITQKQLTNFSKAREIVGQFGISPKFIHIAASGALLHLTPDQQKQIGNVARAGISLYGIDPKKSNPQLKQAIKLTSKIAQIKQLKVGDRVGYDGTFRAEHDMTIAVLPIGYNDGVDRRLSNKGFVEVNGVPCPIVGLVSMNITAIDIAKVVDAAVGQEVSIYSETSNTSIETNARLCGTIPYELLTHITPTTKRIVVD